MLKSMSREGFAPIVILLIVAGVVLAGAAGYFAFVKKPVVLPPPQSSNSVLEWKEYTHPISQYSFSYPGDWSEANPPDFVQMPDYYPPAWHVVSSPNLQRDSSKRIVQGSFVVVQTYEITETLDDVERQIKSSQDSLDTVTLRRIKLASDNMEALKVTTARKTQGTQTIYTIINKKKGFMISCDYLLTDNSEASICEKILSTFRVPK